MGQLLVRAGRDHRPDRRRDDGRHAHPAYLLRARSHVVDEPALVAALRDGMIAGAGIDVKWKEPLPADSPLWDAPGTFITPYTACETRRYEDNVSTS